jgi:hypothetical protein
MINFCYLTDQSYCLLQAAANCSVYAGMNRLFCLMSGNGARATLIVMWQNPYWKRVSAIHKKL